MKSLYRFVAVIALAWSAAAGLTLASDWPQWRGPFRTGYAGPDSPPVNSLAADLQPVWRTPIGGGFSSPVVSQGKLLYLDEHDGQEWAHLLDATSGKEIWKVAYAPVFQDEWGAGPRSTPIIDGDRLYVQACNGEFRCLKLADGATVWQTSFERDFGVKFL